MTDDWKDIGKTIVYNEDVALTCQGTRKCFRFSINPVPDNRFEHLSFGDSTFHIETCSSECPESIRAAIDMLSSVVSN